MRLSRATGAGKGASAQHEVAQSRTGPAFAQYALLDRVIADRRYVLCNALFAQPALPEPASMT